MHECGTLRWDNRKHIVIFSLYFEPELVTPFFFFCVFLVLNISLGQTLSTKPKNGVIQKQQLARRGGNAQRKRDKSGCPGTIEGKAWYDTTHLFATQL